MKAHTRNESGFSTQVEIATWLKYQIISGEYRHGDILPAAHTLASQFDVNPNTVRAAISHLQDEGLVKSKRGLGTIVTADLLQEQTQQLQSLLRDVAQKGQELGLSASELGALLSVWSKANDGPERAWYVDRDHPYFQNFIKTLSQTFDIRVEGVHPERLAELLSLGNGPRAGELVFCSQHSADSVRRELGAVDVRVVELSARMAPQAVATLAKQNPDSTLGIICVEERFAKITGKVLEKQGITLRQIHGHLLDPISLKNVYGAADVVTISTAALMKLNDQAVRLPDVPLVPLWYEFDPEGLEAARGWVASDGPRSE